MTRHCASPVFDGGRVRDADAMTHAADRWLHAAPVTVCSPVAGSPVRTPDTVRRTTSMDVARRSTDVVAVRLDGRARDVVATDAGDVVVASARVVAALDARLSLVGLDVTPEVGDAAALSGVTVAAGFRGRARSAFPGHDTDVVGQLLDDLPVAALIAGYAAMRDGMPVATGSAGKDLIGPMRDVCSGWRRGGALLTSVESGQGLPLQTCPPAPALECGDDPGGWHETVPLAAGSMRRRRRIDVQRDSDGFVVDAMFRDTYGEPDGGEVVLHEYTIDARIDERDVLHSICAVPRVLPAPECPLAAGEVDVLVGVPVDGLADAVRDRLVGTRSCTHLNDLLRSLAALSRLVGSLR